MCSVAFPNVNMLALEANTDNLYHGLSSGIIDMCVNVDAMDSSLFHSELWMQEHIVLAVPRTFSINSKLAQYRLDPQSVMTGEYLSSNLSGVDLSLFANEPFLFMKKRSDMYNRKGHLLFTGNAVSLYR